MKRRSRAYNSVHYRVAQVYGLASDHLCIKCFGPAAHWAYLHFGDSKICPNSGRPYSDEIEEYGPMCRPCHKTFDLDNDPEMAERMRRTGVAAGNRPKNPAHRTALSAAHHLTDDHRAAVKAAMHKTNARRYRCADCPYTSNAGNVGKHLAREGHSTKSEVMPS